MTIKELAREIQTELRDGINDVVIFRRRKQWFYEVVGTLGHLVLEAVKLSDPHAIMVNGWEHITGYTLENIAEQVKMLHGV